MNKQDNNSERLNDRRTILKGTIGVSAVAAIVPSAWTQPLINAVILPAHAQCSVDCEPPEPEPTCPELVIGNVITGPVSGQAQCTITFDVLSSDAAVPVTVSGITNTPVVNPDTVTYNGFGSATETSGPRVVFQGTTTNAPFECTQPINEVTFTVSFTCEAASPTTFTQDFLLSEIGLQTA